MRNEKGVTLIELLVVLALGTIVFGVATMTFFAVQHMWNSSTQEYNDESKISAVIDTVSSYLSDSVEIYIASPAEFRIKTGIGSNQYDFKAFVQDGNNFTMYDLIGVDHTSFKTVFPKSSYTNPITLADNLEEMKILFNSIEQTSGANFKNGEKLTLQFNFQTTTVSINGSRNQTTKTVEKIIKLLKE
jgi:prepilin-type N-terminal cleavage/methylation domain-containing protein